MSSTLALATASPPSIPSGSVEYSNIFDDSVFDQFSEPAHYKTSSAPMHVAEAPAPVESSDKNFDFNINAYTSNYNVRGMGVTDRFSAYGYSSIYGSYVLPNRNLFGMGIYQRVSGEAGIIWGAGDLLGSAPLGHAGYALGKEIFPNLKVELGYELNGGGLEGYMAKARDKCSQRITQELNLRARFDDKQQGFFGGAELAYGFQGLKGCYWDTQVGYRFMDVYLSGNVGFDLELIVGISGSKDYWTGSTEGIDAYRIRTNILPYSLNGKFGRDANMRIAPWVQLAWAGSNEAKIYRDMNSSIIDKFQFTVGCDLGWQF